MANWFAIITVSAAAVAVTAGGLFVMDNVAETDAIETARGFMAMNGTLKDSSTDEIKSWLSFMRDRGAGRGESRVAIVFLASLAGPAAPNRQRIMEVGVAQATLQGKPVGRTVSEIATVFDPNAAGNVCGGGRPEAIRSDAAEICREHGF